MNRLTLIAATAVAVLLALGNTASARLGIAPLSVQDDAVIQAKHGHGHGHHGRGHHRGRGHHYGWFRGRGHHYGHRHHRWY